MARLKLAPLAFTVLLTGCIPTCTEQHDPTQHHNQIWAEQAVANAEQPTLTDEGKLPGASGEAQPVDVAKVYNTYCSTCHGAEGDGKGPGAAALEPKPRDFTDAAWQAAADDNRIATVIKDGGTAVGLSATMAPWGSVLSDEQVAALVGHVRSFKK